MKSKLLVGFAVAMAALSPSAASAATGDADVFLQTTDTAVAQFSSQSGCVVTNVDIIANHRFSQQPTGAPELDERSAFIAITQYDTCADTQVLSVAGSNSELDNKSFAVPGLSSARLTARFDVGRPFDSGVIADVTWSESGPLDRNHQNIHHLDFGPRCRVNAQFTTSARSATVSGNVYDPSDAETNLTPVPGEGVLDSIDERSQLIGGPTNCP